MERRNQLQKSGSKRKLGCQEKPLGYKVDRNVFVHKLSCKIMLPWDCFEDICQRSFKKSAKGGSFTLASLEESYQPFTRFVLKGLKVTVTWPESPSSWDQHQFISTGRNKTQTNNIAILLVWELFKLQLNPAISNRQGKRKIVWNIGSSK